ncbi:hypothetical protein Q1695_003334 [Nippostrongylus brasiliensis]|nr:hypothetical protein Q1695_003334 [Nippostrongylus brasiliensis]
MSTESDEFESYNFSIATNADFEISDHISPTGESTMIVLLTMALVAVLFVISYYYWQLDYWKRRGISGPPARMFFGNIYSLTDVNTPVGTVLREWTKKYGNVYGIQEGLRRTLVISDLDMIRELFTTKFDYFYGRKNHVIVRDVENDPRVHIFEAQGVRWKRLRTIASSAFSTKSLRKIHPTVESSAFVLMRFLDRASEEGAFNIVQFYKEFTMDVIYRIAMGQENSQMFVDKERLTTIDSLLRINFRQPLLLLAAIAPVLRIPLRKFFLLWSSLRGTPFTSLFKQIYEAVDKRIEERANDAESDSTKRQDFVDLFLDARAEQEFDDSAEFTKHGVQVTKQMTRDEIAAQCFVFLVAGYDTTATSLAYVTHLLAMNPTVQIKAQEEIDEHCQETICFDTLTKMRYLDCVVKEALRMYPLASIANSRRCMESTTLNGVKVKEGEYVMVDTFSLHFDTEIWGSNATEFCPERWLDATNPPKAAFLSFGLGPRQCIGMRLAQMEAKLVLAHLLKRFDIVATDRTEKTLTLQGSTTATPEAVTVQLRRR